jgi:hypothetical protein
MLYAQVNEKATWPLVWEEVQDMHKYLNKMSYTYQLILEKKMFATQFGAEYRGALIKWVGNDPVKGERKREVLLETTDPAQMRAALFMLINEAEQVEKAGKRISMVP